MSAVLFWERQAEAECMSSMLLALWLESFEKHCWHAVDFHRILAFAKLIRLQTHPSRLYARKH